MQAMFSVVSIRPQKKVKLFSVPVLFLSLYSRFFFISNVHRLALCPKFIAMEPTQRAQTVFDLGNCFRCLGRNHSSHGCRRTDAICGMKGCNQRHHTLLHGADRVARK